MPESAERLAVEPGPLLHCEEIDAGKSKSSPVAGRDQPGLPPHDLSSRGGVVLGRASIRVAAAARAVVSQGKKEIVPAEENQHTVQFGQNAVMVECLPWQAVPSEFEAAHRETFSHGGMEIRFLGQPLAKER